MIALHIVFRDGLACGQTVPFDPLSTMICVMIKSLFIIPDPSPTPLTDSRRQPVLP